MARSLIGQEKKRMVLSSLKNRISRTQIDWKEELIALYNILFL